MHPDWMPTFVSPRSYGPQVWELLQFIRSKLSARMFEQLAYLSVASAAAAAAAGVVGLIIIGKLNPWTGR